MASGFVYQSGVTSLDQGKGSQISVERDPGSDHGSPVALLTRHARHVAGIAEDFGEIKLLRFSGLPHLGHNRKSIQGQHPYEQVRPG